MIQWGDFLIDPREGEDLCRMAVLLAMTVDQKMERDLILQTHDVPFEDAMFPIPVRSHEYLTRVYGDYMTPRETGYKSIRGEK